MYDHTRIASYRHLRVGNVGGEYGYWLLEGNECSAAGGFPSNPILSGSAPNTWLILCCAQVDLAEKWMSYKDHDGTPLNTRIHWAKESPRSITVGEFLFDPWIRDPGSGIGFFRIPDLGHDGRFTGCRLTSPPLPLAPRRQVEIS